MTHNSVINEIRDGQGYTLGFHLDDAELEKVQELIKNHLLKKIALLSEAAAKNFERLPLDQYHTIAHFFNHAELMKRVNRIMPLEFVTYLRTTSLIRQLKQVFGDFEISDEEQVGRESISLRFVRPDEPNDVGSLHCDDWFWQLYGFVAPKNKVRIKVWVAVCCSVGESGLYISANSQHQDWKYKIITTPGGLKPKLSSHENPTLTLCETQPGSAVAFNYYSLHGGAMTRGLSTRVSMEFTMLVPCRAAI